MRIRQDLSADGLMRIVKNIFKNIPEHRKNLENSTISIQDALMSGLAIFSLKCPSLLNFEEKTMSIEEGDNIKSLFKIDNIASDTQLRDIIDPISPKTIAPAFKKIMAVTQRGKDLEQFVWDVNNSYPVAIDATGFFSSTNIKCPQCLIKELKTKTVKDIKKKIEKEAKKEFKNELKTESKKQTKDIIKQVVASRLATRLEAEEIEIEKVYHHQLLGLSMVHPDTKISLPFCPEPIINSDGFEKNDCEINAAKRLLEQFRKDHPHLKITIIGDGIYSNAPMINLLNLKKMHYLLVAKQSNHQYLFDYIDGLQNIPLFERQNYPELITTETKTSKGQKIVKDITHKFRFVNGVPLNDSNEDLKVNFVEYWEIEQYTDKDGFFHENTCFHSSWVTDIEITKENVLEITRGGRCRWNIENCVFNTLKNQGYHLDHNFGHGKENLCTNFALLMMLAFLIDQVQELSCKIFKAVREKFRTKYNLWQIVRGVLFILKFDNWEMLYKEILCPKKLQAEAGSINSS